MLGNAQQDHRVDLRPVPVTVCLVLPVQRVRDSSLIQVLSRGGSQHQRERYEGLKQTTRGRRGKDAKLVDKQAYY